MREQHGDAWLPIGIKLVHKGIQKLSFTLVYYHMWEEIGQLAKLTAKDPVARKPYWMPKLDAFILVVKFTIINNAFYLTSY